MSHEATKCTRSIHLISYLLHQSYHHRREIAAHLKNDTTTWWGIIKGQVWNKIIHHDYYIIEKQHGISLYLELYIHYMKWRLHIQLSKEKVG